MTSTQESAKPGFFSGWTMPNLFKSSPDDIQKKINALDAKCASDKAALQEELTKAQTAPATGGRRRKHKGGRHTKRHRVSRKGKSRKSRK